MAIKTGCQTYGWYHYRETTGAEVSLQQILQDIRDAGFRYVELCSPTEELGTPEELRQLLDDAGLRLVALTGRVDGGLVEWSKHRIDYLQQFGGEILVVNAGWIQPGEAKTDDRYQALAEGLEELAEYGKPRGVQVTYHNHLGTICETTAEIERLFSMLRKTRYCIDTGHLAAAGADVLETISRMGTRIAYGHLKDARVDPDTGKFLEFVRLGKGNAGVDVRAIADALQTVGFDGWLMVEQDHTHTTPAEDAKANAQTLRELGVEIS